MVVYLNPLWFVICAKFNSFYLHLDTLANAYTIYATLPIKFIIGIFVYALLCECFMSPSSTQWA